MEVPRSPALGSSNSPSPYAISPTGTTASFPHARERSGSQSQSQSRSGSLRRKQRAHSSAMPMPVPYGGMGGDGAGGSSGIHHPHPSSSATAASTMARSQRSASTRASNSNSNPHRPPRRTRDRHTLALESIRHFLKGRSSYDVLPVSFRLIVLDTQLVVGPALEVMWGAGVVSAPLWNSSSVSKPTMSSPEDPIARSAADEPIVEPASAPPTTTTTTTAADMPSSHGHVPEGTSFAPISRSKPGFAGMLTVNDIIHLIQYYYHHSSYETAKQEVDSFRLEGLRDIEAKLAVPPPPLLSCHPLRPLFDACQLLMKTHARRLPLLDHDEQTGMETVVSVLTQYRVLKFIAMNCRETASLHRSLRSLGIGTFVAGVKVGQSSLQVSRRGSEKTDEQSAADGKDCRGASETGAYDTPRVEITEDQMAFAAAAAAQRRDVQQRQQHHQQQQQSSSSSRGPHTIPRTTQPSDPVTNPCHPIYTATLETTVFDVVHMFSERGISAVPIVDAHGNAIDMYESVDVITLVRSGAYQSLDLTIRQALDRRPADFPGVYSCSPDDSIANIFALLRKKRVHRLLIVEPLPEPKPGEPEFLTSLGLEEELEKSGPRIRQHRGRLVGILALSDLLRHIIGLPPHDAAAVAAAEVAAGGGVPSTLSPAASAAGATAGTPSRPLSAVVSDAGLSHTLGGSSVVSSKPANTLSLNTAAALNATEAPSAAGINAAELVAHPGAHDPSLSPPVQSGSTAAEFTAVNGIISEEVAAEKAGAVDSGSESAKAAGSGDADAESVDTPTEAKDADEQGSAGDRPGEGDENGGKESSEGGQQ